MTCSIDSTNNFEQIECTLRPINEYSSMTSEKKRFGRYHGSTFWDIPKFGRKKWVVGIKIDLDFAFLEGVELTAEDITRACLKHLNTPPPRKKYAKKEPRPQYGNLEYYKSCIINRGPEKYISALVITDSRKHKMFWRQGRNV